MSKAEMGKSQTNTDEGSCKELTMGCIPFWEQCQEKAIAKLATKVASRISVDDISEYRIPGFGITIKPDKYFVIKSYHQRARSIAAIYAQIYLEILDSDISNPSLKGRFHWMGLGAFASKTVAYLLSHPSAITSGTWITPGFKEAGEMLACGNFWLYMEIMPWHIAWAICPESFQECKKERDSRKFTMIAEKMMSLEWAEDALAKIGYLRLDEPEEKSSSGDDRGYIEKAFDALEEVEKIFINEEIEQTKYKEASEYLMENLMELAHNEQLNILQPTVWDNKNVVDGAEFQRGFLGQIFGPYTSVALSSDYTIEALEAADRGDYYYQSPRIYGPRENLEALRYKGVIENLPEKPYLYDEGIKPEDPKGRMDYVTRLAETYHALMLDEDGRAFLHKEIGIIASWHHLN